MIILEIVYHFVYHIGVSVRVLSWKLMKTMVIRTPHESAVMISQVSHGFCYSVVLFALATCDRSAYQTSSPWYSQWNPHHGSKWNILTMYVMWWSNLVSTVWLVHSRTCCWFQDAGRHVYQALLQLANSSNVYIYSYWSYCGKKIYSHYASWQSSCLLAGSTHTAVTSLQSGSLHNIHSPSWRLCDPGVLATGSDMGDFQWGALCLMWKAQ